MQYCLKYILLSKSACYGAAIASLSFVLLSGAASSAQAQSALNYGETPPPPPLSASSPYGRNMRGTYVLPGTRPSTSSNRLPLLPVESLEERELPPVRLSGGPASSRPAPNLPTGFRPIRRESIKPSNHQAETPATLRYATPPMPRNHVYYPKPPRVQQGPMPQLEPQTPVYSSAPAEKLLPQEPVLISPPVKAAAAPPLVAAPIAPPSKAIIKYVPIEPEKPLPAALASEATANNGPLPWSDAQQDIAAPEEKLEILPLQEQAEPEPAEPLSIETTEVPQEMPQEMIPETPVLSEESRHILDKTPSGIDSRVIARTPEPVIIKRTDPSAGAIPSIDVRTHEEMGMKIEIRKADINVHSYLEQGYENLIAGHEAIAAGYYSEALKTEPRNELALFGLATTYQRMGNVAQARDLYGQLLAINPTHREALNNFMALVSDEAPQDAIEALEKLETENPDFSPIPAQLGIVYRKMGDNTMAVNKLARALQLSPDNISYKYNLAITLDAMGKQQEAADLYMELLEDYSNGATLPGDIVAIRNRAIFLNGKK